MSGRRKQPEASSSAILSHSLSHDKSILALAVSSTHIIAGTEGGELLSYHLESFRKAFSITAHSGSVLDLLLSADEDRLFSSGADRFVHIWCTNTFHRLYTIYSSYDIGDIYCLAYSAALNVVYLGSQNASIQWYNLKERDSKTPDPSTHPHFREDRFFDSKGPGGVRTPRREYADSVSSGFSTKDLEIDRRYIKPFAHFGYVYCMLLLRGVVTEDPDEETLVSGGGDGSIKLWSLMPEKGGRITEKFELRLGQGDDNSVLSIALDGCFLISGRLRGEVNIWDLETRQLVRTINSSVADVLSLSVGGGCLFVSGSNGTVEKFNNQYEMKEKFKAQSGRILATACTTYNFRKLFITAGGDSSIHLWDLRDCDPSLAGSMISNEKLVDKLTSFVAYQTVSSDPKFRTECRRGASFLRTVFKAFGARTEVLTSDDPDINPVILAVFRRNSKTAQKTRILFYGHYDVISADADNGKWISNPFQVEGVDEYIYGRGTSDNKGPLLAAIYAVAGLLAQKSLEADVVFLVEGEEECGSRGFEDVVRKYKPMIGPVDWILVANSYWLDDHVPCLTYGLRGVIHATLKVTSDRPDVHSGVDGSSLLDESLKDLVLLLNSLVGDKGAVKLPGFYDPVLPMTKLEAALYNDITSALVENNPQLGDKDELAKKLKQKWREASLTIHRFGTSGPGNSTVIPSMAWVSISLRLVPNQEADKIADDLVGYLKDEFRKLRSSNHFHISVDRKAEPWLGDFNNAMYRTLEEGIVQAWSTEGSFSGRNPRRPLYIREGGSIPAVRFLEKEFDAPAAHLPCGQASDNAHLDNERLRLVNLYKSRDVLQWVFRELPRREE